MKPSGPSSLSAAGRKTVGAPSRAEASAMLAASKTDVLETNPFILPADEDVFKMREKERFHREQAKKDGAGRKIWEKTDYSSTLSRTRKLIEDMAPDVDPMALRKARESKGLVTAATAAIARERHREQETMAEFVAKKREMFLVQMSLDIKREEIAKLEAKAAAKEEALRKSELMLEEDAVRFDAFLKENDQQAHDAMRRAEGQSKLKTEKMNELKKLRHAIGLVTAERGKLKETLEDYTRYKVFLDGLTPGEWVAECTRARREDAERKRVANHEARLREWEAARAGREAELLAEAEAQRRAALRAGRPPPKLDIPALLAASTPPPPRLEDEPLPALTRARGGSGSGGGAAASSGRGGAGMGAREGKGGDEGDEEGEGDDGEDIPMYFTRPEQLLEIFTQLEESNLFLIQNCQDTEEQLEELRTQHAETAASLARQTALLQESMQALQVQLAAEEAKVVALQRKIGDTGSAAGAGAGGAAAAGGGEAEAAGAGAAAAGAGGAAGSGAGAGGRARGGAGVPSTARAGAGGGSTAGTPHKEGASGGGGAGATPGGPAAEAALMEAVLPELRSQIMAVYERCGFKATASSDTISMLAHLEGRLEGLLAQLATMDPEYVAMKEKEKERERRVRVREARLKQQKEQHEVRLRRMLERAQAPVQKREGKPVMFRSAPPPKKVVADRPDPAVEQEKEDLKYWL